ncbi:MAG: DUF4190 domain-containing protein [Cellulomonas sp.]
MSNDQQGPDAQNEPQPPAWGAAPGRPTPYGQPGQPTPYGQPGQPTYGQPLPYGPPQPNTTDGMSIAALITGILGLGVVPVVLGILGLKRTKERGTSGRGLAIAGIVLGAAELVLGVILVAVSLIAVLGFSTSETSSGSVTVQTEAPTPADQATENTSDSAGSGTALLDTAPLEVAGFTTDALIAEPGQVQAGALESYTATYTDGTSTIEAVLTDWTTEAEGQAWAATQDAAFTPDQLTDSGDDGDGITYKLYEVGDVATVVATNYTAAFTLTGPYDAVVAIYQEYPL